MKTQRTCLAGALAAAAALVLSLPLGAASEKINLDDINKIKTEGMKNSEVMDISSWLEDINGPRLTGSPNVKKAADWAVAEMKRWGLDNVNEEPWPNRNGFVRGWQNDKFYMAAVSPQAFPIPGTPTGWTPGTKGLVRGEVVLITETAEADLQKYVGKLQGKWILTQAPQDVPALFTAPAARYTDEQLGRMAAAAPPAAGGGRGGRAPAPTPTPPTAAATTPPAGTPPAGAPPAGAPPAGARPAGAPPAAAARGRGRGAGGGNGFNRNDFFFKEGVAGTISTDRRGHGIYTISGNRATDPVTSLPAVVIPAEQYGRMARILAKGLPVVIEADIRNTYTPNPPMFNIVGEIRGTDLADEVVMLGAHFDSWHAATGATDNGAGSAAMMEAMRILKQSGVKMRRTVRIGLWTGEEQGLLGSCEYVSQHFGTPEVVVTPPDPNAPAGAGGRGGRGGGGGGCEARQSTVSRPAKVTPEHAKFAGYFNIDNGTGAIRGVYLQGNAAVGPIFTEWMAPVKDTKTPAQNAYSLLTGRVTLVAPFRDLGMTTVTISNTGGTDHQSFDAVDLPGFQFIQDAIDYETTTHHTNLDTYERLQKDDMMKNATIAAAFAYLTANRDEKLPRKPMPAAGRGGQ